MKKVLFVKNIIPPYRITLFNTLQQEIVDNDNMEFQVFVFNRNEKGRSWHLEEKGLNFNHIIDDTGFYKKIKGFNLRFNPLLFKIILKSKDIHLILGSSWNDPNIIALVIFKRLGLIKNTLSFWSEANYHTFHKSKKPESNLKIFLRKFVLDTCDGNFLLPGAIAQKTLFEYWKIKKRPVIYLPNLISEIYHVKSESPEIFISPENNLKILIVARHNESHKGILKFIKNLNTLQGLTIFLAGSGDDTCLYEKFVVDNGLGDVILFLGNLEEEILLKYYRTCDIFVLPSNYDQSPLAIVEAASLSLPLLVSERCGNHIELVKDGENGFVFDPDNSIEINKRIDFFKTLDRNELIKMGEVSLDLVKSNYDSKKILRNFINSI